SSLSLVLAAAAGACRRTERRRDGRSGGRPRAAEVAGGGRGRGGGRQRARQLHSVGRSARDVQLNGAALLARSPRAASLLALPPHAASLLARPPPPTSSKITSGSELPLPSPGRLKKPKLLPPPRLADHPKKEGTSSSPLLPPHCPRREGPRPPGGLRRGPGGPRVGNAINRFKYSIRFLIEQVIGARILLICIMKLLIFPLV
ncbi:Os05g0396700, partial [Oryza sativa Japonica Group]